MKELIKRNSSGRKVLILFSVTIIVYLVMLTITIPKVMSYSGGMNLLDMMPAGYDAEYANNLLSSLGEQGRNAYLYIQLPVDMVYPLLFGVSYCLVLAYFLNKLGKTESFLFYLCYLPLFAGLFDYLENFGIIAMLNTYPSNPGFLTQITNVFSVLKSFLTTIYFVILIICLIVFVIRRLFLKSL